MTNRANRGTAPEARLRPHRPLHMSLRIIQRLNLLLLLARLGKLFEFLQGLRHRNTHGLVGTHPSSMVGWIPHVALDYDMFSPLRTWPLSVLRTIWSMPVRPDRRARQAALAAMQALKPSKSRPML